MSFLGENALVLIDRYTLKFGIFSEDGDELLTATGYNLDGTKSSYKIEAANALYLLDQGSILVPAKKLLNKCIPIIEKYIIPAVTTILMKDITGSEYSTYSLLNNAAKKAEKEIKSFIFSNYKNDEIISIILKSDDSDQLVNMAELSKYIKVKVIKKY